MLEKYCAASGQRINHEKSSIFSSKRCPDTLKDSIKNALLVHKETLNERYLGMPTDVGRSKNGTFKYLRDRVLEKIKGWMEKLLSSAGKEVLIKAVAQAIPVYSMSCFRLPRGLCENITSIIRQFWWGSKQGKRKLIQRSTRVKERCIPAQHQSGRPRRHRWRGAALLLGRRFGTNRLAHRSLRSRTRRHGIPLSVWPARRPDHIAASSPRCRCVAGFVGITRTQGTKTYPHGAPCRCRCHPPPAP